MDRKNTVDFLKRHGMYSHVKDLPQLTEDMRKDMERGLAGEDSSMAMIPTYIKGEGAVAEGESVIVIDAGGTNYRRALAVIENGVCHLSHVEKCIMPGVENAVSWDEFISFVVDSIAEGVFPLINLSDNIAFCFSYTADITPELDGRVISMDKEVEISGAVGQLVAASLTKELEHRGIHNKKIIILNDTVAALLGASCFIDKQNYSGIIGQICGTGTNTCCLLPYSRIGKLSRNDQTEIFINLESGLYKGISFGDYDIALDCKSQTSGDLIMEKLIAGAYIGPLAKLMLKGAADEKLLSYSAAARISALGKIDASYVDDWACGERMELVCDNSEDAELISTICQAIFKRAAICTCANLTAIMELLDIGKDASKPVCICGEGSLIERSKQFMPLLTALMDGYSAEIRGRHAKIIIGRNTTQVGSAIAALLNRE